MWHGGAFLRLWYLLQEKRHYVNQPSHVSMGPGGLARGLIDKLDLGEGQMLRAAQLHRHAKAYDCSINDMQQQVAMDIVTVVS